MSKPYECTFPDTDREPDFFFAKSFEEAAEKAAAVRCQVDVDWRNHVVSVRLGHQEKRFDVECRSQPVFYARSLTSTI